MRIEFFFPKLFWRVSFSLTLPLNYNIAVVMVRHDVQIKYDSIVSQTISIPFKFVQIAHIIYAHNLADSVPIKMMSELIMVRCMFTRIIVVYFVFIAADSQSLSITPCVTCYFLLFFFRTILKTVQSSNLNLHYFYRRKSGNADRNVVTRSGHVLRRLFLIIMLFSVFHQ